VEFEANRVVPAEVSIASKSPMLLDLTAASRREVRTCALGGGTLGARHGNADVRIQREAEGSAGTDFEKVRAEAKGAWL